MADSKKTMSTAPKTDTTVAKAAKATPQAVAETVVVAKKDTEKKVAPKVEPKAEPKKAPVEKKQDVPVEKKAAPAEKKTVKSAVKKTVKSAAKKVSKKKAPVETVQEVYFQYDGQEILSQDIVTKIEESYKAEGHRISAIKSLRVYIKPEDGCAYYVINEKDEGKSVDL